MLEIIDASIPLLVKVLNDSIDTSPKGSIYSDPSWALRLRQDIISQTNSQENVVPFMSYFRSKTQVERFNQRLNKVGIPYDSNSNSPGRLTYTPVQPMSAIYNVILWEKDGIKVMEWLKYWYSRYLKVQNITIFVDDNVSYKLTAQLSNPIDAFYKENRANFPEVGQMFLFKFDIKVIGAIPDIKVQNSKYRIEVVKVNYEMNKEILKQEFTVDNDGKVTPIL